MFSFPAAQQTSTAKLQVFFQKVSKKVRQLMKINLILKIDEIKFITENTSSQNRFGLLGNCKTEHDEKTHFCVSCRVMTCILTLSLG